MTRVPRTVRLLAAAILLGFVTPVVAPAAPAVAAENPFGGFTASAESALVRVGIFEPALPIPAEPQIDASVGYARASSSTGPTSRALASYLWPGDTLGDGLGVLFGNEALDYPVKVNSKYPASDSAPATNAAEVVDGSGMSTSADETTTIAAVSAADVGTGTPLPLPVATAVTMDVAKSRSSVELGEKVVSHARARATGLQLLGGLITVDGFDMDLSAISDGVKASAAGNLAISGLTVAGKRVQLGNAVSIDGGENSLPEAPLDFPALGIKIEFLKQDRAVDGASAKLGGRGMTVTVDVAVLGKQLGLGTLSDALAPVIGDIPQLGPLLTGLLKFGTKLVITVGDVRVAATATPAFVAPPFETPPGTGFVPPAIDTALPPVPGVGELPVGVVPVGGALAPEVTPVPQNVAFQFPGLTQTSSLLLLAALALAGLLGWGFRAVGVVFFGADDCLLGASVGVPNLREG